MFYYRLVLCLGPGIIVLSNKMVTSHAHDDALHKRSNAHDEGSL